jgi:hypothetical protein
MTMKNVVLWDVMQCGPCKNQRVGGTHRFRNQAKSNRRAR